YSRDTVGPMANSVDDIILIDSVITGSKAVMPPQAGTIRLGVPAFFWSDLHPDVKSSAESALDRLRAAGVTLIPVEMDGIEALTGAVATAVAIYEAKPALTDYLASRGTGKTLDEVVAQISSPDVRGTFSAMVVPGMVPSADGMVPVAPLYEKAQSEGLAALSALYEKTFTDHKLDALVFPTTPEVARFSNEEASAGPTFLRTIRNTDPGSNVRMPGLSLPIGLGPQTNLPVGVEIDGLPGSDAKLLAIGKTLESIWGPGPQPNNLK
ncbi:MAG: amidase, partial [Oceanospirillales bacterium]|nr:amidase [Oceanospirillales bacterium]